MPLLYNHIVVDSQNLEIFGNTFPVSKSDLVQSLTIQIDPVQPARDPAAPEYAIYAFVEDEEQMQLHGSENTQCLWRHLRNTPNRIARMVNLTTFSFTITRKETTVGFWIPRPIIADLLRDLPSSCVNLEIDTRGHDFLTHGYGHLCDNIRAVLPRLHHLRLRLNVMCPALFGTGYCTGPRDNVYANFKPVNAPYLRTVAINCIPLGMSESESRICGTFQEIHNDPYNVTIQKARITLVHTLSLAKDASCFPAAGKIHVMSVLPAEDWDRSGYTSFVRGDVLSNVGLAIPVCKIGGFDLQDDLLARLPNEHEYIGHPSAIEDLAEGEMWTESIGGARAPAALATKRDSMLPKKTLLAQDTVSWKASHPRKSCMLWVNEKASGIRLLDPECRQGLQDITSANVAPVTEKTPAGWRRISNGERLEKIP